MSRNIAVSDDIYERLKREKGDRSFSELLREKLEKEGSISEVAGKNILSGMDLREIKKDVEELSSGTAERMEG
ncbi:MAG: antitoxin VapB family protein [Candidatus Nanohaloarchaea archaeon]